MEIPLNFVENTEQLWNSVFGAGVATIVSCSFIWTCERCGVTGAAGVIRTVPVENEAVLQLKG